MNKSILLTFLFLFAFVEIIYAQSYLDEGLFFYSHEVAPEKRTSLNLTNEEPIHFKNKFSIEFEVNFRRGDGYYGNILKIIGDDRLNIDLVANLIDEEDNFWLTVKDKVIFKYKWSDIPKGSYNKWIKFNIEIDSDNSKLTMSINQDKIVKTSKEIEGISNFNFIFGKSLINKFVTTDVCPMSVKNIKIFNNEGNLVRNWVLGKHSKNNKIYDNVINDEAIVNNPKWLIDQHLYWTKSKDFKFNKLLGFARDDQSGRIFFIDSKAVYVYSILNSSMKTFSYKDHTLQCQSNFFVYNKFKNQLIAYSIDEKYYSTFDFDKLQWSNSDKICDETDYLQHNKMISPKDSTLITFAGYGHYKYKSQLKKFDPKNSKLNSYDLSNKITPRYLSSSGILNSNEFLIFGGYGSKSGKQGVNSQFYYDLYSVNFKDFKVKKLWNKVNLPSQPFVPVQSMVIDDNSDSFYTLIYNNTKYNSSLKLARFGINTDEMTLFPNYIPYKFLDIKSNADFFLNAINSKLYTLTTSGNKVSLYSLAYPPLLSSDIYQNEIYSIHYSKYYWILAFILAISMLFVFLKHRKKSKKHLKTEDPNEEILQLIYPKSEKIKNSAIYIFGNFQIYDKEGNDITSLFTPTIKELFLLILLSSIKNDKGISSKKLTELLWPNKSESNARNNKNVSLSRLRLLLDKIGDIDINNENTYWQINFGESVFCDYYFVSHKLNETNLDQAQIYEILNIVSRGEISPDFQTEWMEDFRTEISNLIIDNLDKISKTQDDLHLLILISNVILKYDSLNEDSIALKCKSLYKLGKKGLAKQSYNQFCNEYLNLLDSKYDVPFNDIIE